MATWLCSCVEVMLAAAAATLTVWLLCRDVGPADGSGSSVEGTKTSQECSGRGTCDRRTGECECYDDFGPSDRTVSVSA